MNAREFSVREVLKTQGWKVLRSGWPDFLCVRRVNGRIEVKGVEVKAVGEKVRPHQKRIHRVLKLAGISTEVVRPSAYPSVVYIKIPHVIIRQVKTVALQEGCSIPSTLRMLIKEAIAARKNGR